MRLKRIHKPNICTTTSLFTYYKIQAYKGHVKHSKAQFNFRASEAQLVAFYNYYCYSFSSYYYYHFYNYHYALSDNKL